jgi:hypothetical protein
VTENLIGSESRVVVAASVYARPFEAEIVLLDFSVGEYFGLDEVGAEVWRGLEGGRSLGAIADLISERFEVTREIALADIVSLVTEMRARNLVDVKAT